MKKLWIALAAGVMFLPVIAADRLPEYDSPQWHKLPGLKEVKTAAEKGDPHAIFLLANAILDCKKKSGKAIDTIDREWEFKSYAAGIPELEFQLAGSDQKKILAAYRKFAEAGFYLAQQYLAWMLLESGDPEFVRWCQKAADQGDDASQYNLGKAYIEGTAGKTDPAVTLKYWQLAAAQGNVGALKDLGIFYQNGIGGKADMAKAIKYYKLATAKGSSEAAYLLGEIYEEGINVKVDKTLAAKYFRIAAKKERGVAEMLKINAENKFQIAMHYERTRNPAMRDKYLLLAAAAGHKKAPVSIIRNKFRSGNRSQKEAAIRELTAIAEKGDSYAQFNLAFLYFTLKRNDEGIYWYCRSLGNGEMTAFTIAPEVLWDNAKNFTDEHKKLLKGVLLQAQYLDKDDMKYLAMLMLNSHIFPEDDKTSSKYYDILFKKGYPKVVFPFLCLTLQQNKNLSDADKADIVLQIDRLSEYLRDLAARGDNEAAFIIEKYSQTTISTNPDQPKKEQKND